MFGELNYKYHILFLTNTAYNTMVLGTTSVLQLLLFPKKKQESKKI